MKRGYYSFWILLCLYAIGLAANLICNDKPLYLRYNGKSYFPVLFDYAERAFLPNGNLTRPNYPKLNKAPAFTENPDNYMIFPLIPHSPYSIASAESLDLDPAVTITLTRQEQVATVNLTPEFTIASAQNPEFFFAQQSGRALRGSSIQDYWQLPDAIRAAVQTRFANTTAAALTAEAIASSGGKIEISLSEYEPRSRAPRSVRITLRERLDASQMHTLRFDPAADEILPNPFWSNIPDTQQAEILAAARQRVDAFVADKQLRIDATSYTVSYQKADVYYPYPPTGDHYLGLDSSGRDVSARIIYALRTSLNFGFALVIISMAIGILIGAIQGYCGGLIDLISQRLIEIWESLPFLYVIILMGSVYGRSFGLLLFVYCIFNWVGISYYMRGELFKLRKQPFVEAAHCMGIAPIKVVWRHLLPNGIVPIVTFFPFSLIGAISVLATLDYLGFGLPPPEPSWGELFSQYQEFKYAWWLVLYPSLALFIVCLLGAFIGEGVRAAFDPRTNSRIE